MPDLGNILDMSGLTSEDIANLAGQDPVPEMTACLLGEYMMHTVRGAAHVRQMIVDDIREAMRRHNIEHARDLYAVLVSFLTDNPEATRTGLAA